MEHWANNEQRQRNKRTTYVDRYEFEEPILCEGRDDDFMSSLRVVIEERESASMSLDEDLSRFVEGTGRMLAEQGWRIDTKTLFNL